MGRTPDGGDVCPAYNAGCYGKKLQSQEKAGIIRAPKTDAVFHQAVLVHRLRAYLLRILAFEPAGLSHSLVFISVSSVSVCCGLGGRFPP